MVYKARLRTSAPGTRRRALATALAVFLAALPALAAPPAVPTVVVGAGTSGGGFEVDGNLEALQQSTVAAQLGGNILWLAPEEGLRIGQPGERVHFS